MVIFLNDTYLSIISLAFDGSELVFEECVFFLKLKCTLTYLLAFSGLPQHLLTLLFPSCIEFGNFSFPLFQFHLELVDLRFEPRETP